MGARLRIARLLLAVAFGGDARLRVVTITVSECWRRQQGSQLVTQERTVQRVERVAPAARFRNSGGLYR
jgi:hypothetical protein